MGTVEQLFGNTYTKDYLGLTKNSQIIPSKVAEFLNFDKNEVSKFTGVSKQSVRYDEKIPKAVKDRLDQIGNICLLVGEFFKDAQKTAIWFQASNPLLGGISPRDMIRFGRYKKLMQFILDAKARQEK